jgi:hypothetical protein
METYLMEFLRALAALATGALIGYGFGLAQNAALRHNEKRQKNGTLKSAWSLMPGSGARIAYLLVALLLVQLVCPLLFADGTQWLVSAGTLAGYGWVLFADLRRKLKASAS